MNDWIERLAEVYKTGIHFLDSAVYQNYSTVFWMPDLKNIFSKMNLYVMNKLASKQDAEHPTTYLSWKLFTGEHEWSKSSINPLI
jgi:hypothetical protein